MQPAEPHHLHRDGRGVDRRAEGRHRDDAVRRRDHRRTGLVAERRGAGVHQGAGAGDLSDAWDQSDARRRRRQRHMLHQRVVDRGARLDRRADPGDEPHGFFHEPAKETENPAGLVVVAAAVVVTRVVVGHGQPPRKRRARWAVDSLGRGVKTGSSPFVGSTASSGGFCCR